MGEVVLGSPIIFFLHWLWTR